MKRSEFPEKAYESMFMHELLTQFAKAKTTPFYIPSQVVEKRLGYDALFVDESGNPLNRKVMLIQFKTSEAYTKKQPHKHYKFEIYKSNDIGNPFRQHNKLCRFNLYGSSVAGVYAAPRFILYKDFLNKVRNSAIIADSEFFIPTTCLYSGHHYVTFDNSDARQCSREEIKIEKTSFNQILQKIEPISKEQFEEILNNKEIMDEPVILNIEEDYSNDKVIKRRNNIKFATDSLVYLFI